LEFVKILISIKSGYIQTHYQKNKKIKRADQILPEVYGTTLSALPNWAVLIRVVEREYSFGDYSVRRFI
jgi:hypothetical protein